MRCRLLTILGDRDPHPARKDENGVWTAAYEPNDGPILSFLDLTEQVEGFRQWQPEAVTVLYAPEPHKRTEHRVLELSAALEARGLAFDFEKLNVDDPTDFTQLLESMGDVARSVVEADLEADWSVLISPGTPQMQAVWLCLANEGRLRVRLLQNKEARQEPDPTRRVREVRYHPLFESEYIRLATELMGRYDFAGAESALAALEARTVSSSRRAAAGLLKEVSKGYALWDSFRYDSARAHFDRCFLDEGAPYRTRLTDGGPSGRALFDLLQRQRETLANLERGDLCDVALDLYWSSERARERGQLVDCIWRAWTMYETLIIQTAETRLREVCGIPKEISLNHDLDALLQQNEGTAWRDDLAIALRPEKEYGNRFDVPMASRYLRRDRHPEYCRAEASCKQGMRRLQDTRNNVLHRFVPIKQTEASQAIQVAGAYLQAFLNLPMADIQAYSFGHSSLAAAPALYREYLQ